MTSVVNCMAMSGTARSSAAPPQIATRQKPMPLSVFAAIVPALSRLPLVNLWQAGIQA